MKTDVDIEGTDWTWLELGLKLCFYDQSVFRQLERHLTFLFGYCVKVSKRK